MWLGRICHAGGGQCKGGGGEGWVYPSFLLNSI